jgi:ATP-dependent DNA helicase 2 subunit 2
VEKAKNETLLKALVGQCKSGLFGTMAEALSELDTPRLKVTKPYKTYDGALTLGDPGQDDRAMSIHIERYFKTKRATPPSASSRVQPTGPSQTAPTGAGFDDGMNGDADGVKSTRTYKVEDPDAPGGKRDIEFEELAKGYEYGRTVVHISESDFNITKYETTKSFSIVGFIPFSGVSHPDSRKHFLY